MLIGIMGWQPCQHNTSDIVRAGGGLTFFSLWYDPELSMRSCPAAGPGMSVSTNLDSVSCPMPSFSESTLASHRTSMVEKRMKLPMSFSRLACSQGSSTSRMVLLQILPAYQYVCGLIKLVTHTLRP